MVRPKNCRNCRKQKKNCTCGRPEKITPETLNKLEEAFMHLFNDEEACLYANIGTTTLYSYQKQNPLFTERKCTLRLTPNLHAKRELVSKIQNNLDQARWWAKNNKTMQEDFGEMQEVKYSRTIAQKPEFENEVDKLTYEYNEKLRLI